MVGNNALRGACRAMRKNMQVGFRFAR